MGWGRAVAVLAGGLLLLAGASVGAQPVEEIALWDNATGPHLRGAVITQRRQYDAIDGPTALGPGPVGPPFGQADFNALAALGANLLVISHPGLFAETPPYGLDQGVQANLDRLVAMAAGADLFVVIAFRTGPGRSEFTFHVGEAGTWFGPEMHDDSVWGDPAAQAAWAKMWGYTAARYRGVPNVVGYELMVEPNSNLVGTDARNPLEVWDPEAFRRAYGGTLLDWNRMVRPIVAAVRAVDPDTPVLVGGNGFSAIGFLPSVQPVADPRAVYIAHTYEPFAYTHQGPDEGLRYPGVYDVTWDGQADAFDASFLDVLLAPLDAFRAAWGRPVAVTEYGAARWVPDGDRFLADLTARLEARGLNSAIFEWPAGFQPYAEISNTFNLRFGPAAANAAPVARSPVLDLLAGLWRRNVLRPSTATLAGQR